MKILYVTTVSNTVNTFLIPHVKMLINEGHTVDVAFNVSQEIKPEIKEIGCKIHLISFQRSPLRKDNIKACRQIKKVIIEEKYDLIHTHTPIASAITRVVCKSIKGVKVVYTAHGFHFYKGAPLLNWLTYYPIERWLARYTDVLVTINKEDYNRAKKFKADRVEYVPGVGIDTKKINQTKTDKIKKRKELQVPEKAFLLLSVGELNKNKNHEIVIQALAEINNQKTHYIICGQGPLEEKLKRMSIELGLESQVHFLGFRKDVPELCLISDLFIFPSYREGLSVSLMESMTLGLPVVASKIRGNSDLIVSNKGGYLFSPNNVSELKRTILNIYNASEDEILSMSKYNKNRIEKYDIHNVINIIGGIYNSSEKKSDSYEFV